MAQTFNQMAEEAMAEVPVINAGEAHHQIEENSETLVIDLEMRQMSLLLA